MTDLAERRKWIRLGWGQVAEEYAKDRVGIFKLGANRVLEHLRPSLGSSLLDVGCGNGIVTLVAVEWVGSEGKVCGTDIAAAMVQLAQRSIPQEVDNVSLSQMDAELLGFNNDSFDNVSCAFSLFQFLDMEQALEEMWRVLKPGGRLGLSNWGPGYFHPIAALQRDLFREFGLKPLLANPVVFKSDDLKRMLYRAGFTSVDIMEETQELWFKSPEEVWNFNLDMGPFPIMLQRQLSDVQQIEILHRFKNLLMDLMTERGIESTFHLLYAIAEKGG